MDNYTMIQNAARRPESVRNGFASLSRLDQADRWAAWQACADAPRTYACDTYMTERPASRETPDMFVENERALRGPAPVEACAKADEPCPAPPPEPQPRRSFALYNEITARHNQVFGSGR